MRMRRFTRWQDGHAVLSDGSATDGTTGPAIDRLYQLEEYYFSLLERQQAIPLEMEALRAAGRTKTVRFRELMAERIMVSTALARMDAPVGAEKGCNENR